MISKKLTIKNRTGLHARPAAVLVQTADRFKADVYLTFNEVRVNAKSIIGVLSLGIGRGDSIKLSIDGEDEKEALEALVNVVEERFGEKIERE